MKVLFVGGTRDFGKITVRRLLERDDDVTIFSRGNVRPDFWDDVDHIAGDRNDHDGFVEVLKGRQFDAVIDNVAYVPDDVREAIRTFKGNVGKYVVSSSVSVYGGPGHSTHWRTVGKGPGPSSEDEYVDLAANVPLMEESIDLAGVSWDLDPTRDAYADGKRQMSRLLSETPDFPWVVMRIPSVLGPDERSDRLWFYLQRILDGREMVLRDGGLGMFRPGFRDDVGQAFVDVIDSPRAVNEIYNITGNDIVNLRRFIGVIAEAACRTPNTVSIPGNVVETASDLPWQDWWYDFFSRMPAYIPSIDKARRHFEMKTTPIETWMAETVEWYATNPQPDSNGYEYRDAEVALCQRWRNQYGAFEKAFTA